MSLFRKKEKPACCCGSCNFENINTDINKNSNSAKVKILGQGCAKCNALESATVQALKELGLDTAVEHISDYAKIASYGVMTTPALVYNEKVISYGKVLKVNEIKALLQKEV